MDRTEAAARQHGVPLEDLAERLVGQGEAVHVDGDTLSLRRRDVVTTITARVPAALEGPSGEKRAVVEVRHSIPSHLSALVSGPLHLAAGNRLAVSGALMRGGEGQCFVGSRLTIMAGEEHAWGMHMALLELAAVAGADAIIGVLGSAFAPGASPQAYPGMRPPARPQARAGREGISRPRSPARSAWRVADFQFVVRQLERVCACSGGGLSAVAEFPLADGQVSATAGHGRTALWKATAEEPHPALGGGLLCLLELPVSASGDEELAQALELLNRWEMEDEDGPPHFGAWCEGRHDGNPAYVSFLPNALHPVRGIALNMACWAVYRARRADELLASWGFGEGRQGASH